MPDNHDRALDVLADVLEAPEELRHELLDGACGGEPGLRDEVQRLLRLGPEAAGFLDVSKAAPDTRLRRFGPYRVVRLIGEGGMGSVYEAEQQNPRRRVALKVIKPGMDTSQVIARFEAEREALALMKHPNIACVYDAGVSQAGRPYFVMELVEGSPVTQYCDTHRLSLRQRLDLFIRVCRAVQHAHQQGIIHRDLKPANVLVTTADGGPAPKVIDFGIAKATSAQSSLRQAQVTECRQLIGTPAYMSPEQADGSGIDTRSDIYSLGVVLYELLTAHTPFDHRQFHSLHPDEVRRIIREIEPPRPSARAQGLHGELDWVIMKCLEKDRARRYGTANELAADLERYLRNEPVLAGPPTAAYRFRKFARRHRAALSAAAAMLLLLVGGVIGTTAGMIRARDAERTAEQGRLRAEELLRRTTHAEALARRELTQVNVLNDFLADMFRVGRPVGAGNGRDVRVVDVVNRAVETLPQRFHNQPEAEIAMRRILGVTYGHLAFFEAAVENLTRAYELAREHVGKDSDQALELGARLALWMSQNTPTRTRLQEAKVLAAHVKHVAQAKHGEGDPIAYFAAEALGWAHVQLKEYRDAEKLYLAMIDIQKRHPDAARLSMAATAYRGLALAQLRLERPDEAADNQRHAMRLMAGFPYTHYPLLHVQHHRAMGLILRAQGYGDGAAKEFAEALKAQEYLGHAHPAIERTGNDYINVLLSLGNQDAAAEFARQRRDRALEDQPADYVLIERRARRLVDLLRRAGRHDQLAEAQARHQEALDHLVERPLVTPQRDAPPELP